MSLAKLLKGVRLEKFIVRKMPKEPPQNVPTYTDDTTPENDFDNLPPLTGVEREYINNLASLAIFGPHTQ